MKKGGEREVRKGDELTAFSVGTASSLLPVRVESMLNSETAVPEGSSSPCFTLKALLAIMV
jgi:hypothetical protein